MREALSSWHIGKVVTAYRQHPFHRKTLAQEQIGSWVGMAQAQMSRFEGGPVVEDLSKLRMWARVLQIPENLLWFKVDKDPSSTTTAATGEGRQRDKSATASTFRDISEAEVSEPIDEAYIALLRQQMQQLLAIDAQCGGNEASVQAVRLFRSVHRRIGSSPCPRHLRRDFYATAGELAEIAGWLLYDADRQDVMRRINQEALYHLRWAGDRSLELLTLQNMSMQSEYLNRPSEALHITQSVLETNRLSPRLEALFLARGAHALAQQKQHHAAMRTFDRAHALYLDGTCDDDPSWAYWIDDRQFAWFEAMLYAELGNPARTVDIFSEALATSPKHRVRGLYSRSVYLFDSLVKVADWRQAEQLIPKLVPYILEVGSGRTASILRGSLQNIYRADAPRNLRDGAMHLRGLLG